MKKQGLSLSLANITRKLIIFFSEVKLSIRAKILWAFLIVLLMMGFLNIILVIRLWQYSQQYEMIWTSFSSLVYTNIVVMGFVLAFSILAAWIISESIYIPIKELHDDITTIVQRDLKVPIADGEADEITELGLSFNIMTEKINATTAQLRELIDSLEDQVQERTADLSMSLEVGQRAATIRNLDELLPTITEFIRQQFSLYYTRVYLVDDIDQNLVFKAGAGEAGLELEAPRHSLPIDSNSVAGEAALQGQPIVVSDAKRSDIHTSDPRMPRTWYTMLMKASDMHTLDPVLPETRSELTVPLIVQGRVIGVLDMHDDEVNTFTVNNLNVFEAIAVQLAIAIDSAQQWALTQEAQKRAEEAIRQLTREAWAERLASTRDDAGFAYDLSRISPLLPDAYSLAPTPENGHSVPLVVQDQTIGYLSVKTPGDRDLTEDEGALLQAVAQQLAQKAENLRLFEATQQRASREQIARRIIDKVRASRNIEMALKTAAEELNKALRTARVVVDLQVAPQPTPAEEQNTDSAEIKSAQDNISSVRPDEASSPFNFKQGASPANVHHHE